jgi:hypothetical protein
MMEIKPRNMVALHLRRRLRQYIRFRYAPQRELQLKYKDSKRLVDSCCRVRKVPVIDDEGCPTGQSTSVWNIFHKNKDMLASLTREPVSLHRGVLSAGATLLVVFGPRLCQRFSCLPEQNLQQIPTCQHVFWVTYLYNFG